MKITCIKSGIQFRVEGFSNNEANGEHPIFSVAQRKLIEMAARDWPEKFNGKPFDERLLFLALLDSTRMIEWRMPARPSLATVKKYMPHVLKFINWYNAFGVTREAGMGKDEISFPRFVIDPDTYTLESLRHWLYSVDMTKDAWEQRTKDQNRITRIRMKEERLARYIKSVMKKPPHYLSTLFDWAADASNIHSDRITEWKEIFTATKFTVNNRGHGIPDNWLAVYKLDELELHDMFDHLTHRLEHGSIFAHEVMQQAKLLLWYKKKGVEFGMGEFSEDELDIAEIEAHPYRMIADSELEAHNKQATASLAPKEEPKEGNYSTRTQYLVAIARWRVARSNEEKRERIEGILEQQKKKQDEIAEEYQEEIEQDTEVDPRQLGIDFSKEDSGFNIVPDEEV